MKKYSLRGKAAIISDVHLGSVTCLHHQVEHFLEVVHSGEFTLLVIVGDLLESTVRKNRLERRDWKILSKLRRMSDDLDILWISGNHDAYHPEVLAGVLGIDFVGLELQILTKKDVVICLHGHQFDTYITKHPMLTSLLSWLYLIVQKVDRRHRIAQTAKKLTKKIMACAGRVKCGACKYRDSQGNATVICGHTHKSEIDSEAKYVNTGSWTEIPGDYVVIDEEGNINLYKWEESF